MVAHSGAERAENACSFLEGVSPEDRPFFLDVGFIETHCTANLETESGGQIAWHNASPDAMGDPRYVQVPPPFPTTRSPGQTSRTSRCLPSA